MPRWSHIVLLTGRWIQTRETDGINVKPGLPEDAVGDEASRAKKQRKTTAANSADVVAESFALASEAEPVEPITGIAADSRYRAT